MPEILAFISPDADRAMREYIMLLFYMRGIPVTDDMKRATIVVMPDDAPKLRKEIEPTMHTFTRMEHVDIQEIVIPTHTQKHKKSFMNNNSVAGKKYNCAKTMYAQRFFNRTTCK